MRTEVRRLTDFLLILTLICLPAIALSKADSLMDKTKSSCSPCMDPCDPCCEPFTGSVTFLGGYFLPLSERFRDVYTGCSTFGLAFNYKLWKPIYLWAELDGIFGMGKTSGDRNTTRIRMAHFDLGLKYVYRHQINSRSYFFPYLGFAPEIVYFNTHVDSTGLINSQSHWTVGFAVDPGMMFRIDAFAIDIFAKYSWAHHSMHNTRDKPVIVNSANLSGFTFGAGVGYIW